MGWKVFEVEDVKSYLVAVVKTDGRRSREKCLYSVKANVIGLSQPVKKEMVCK